MKFQYTIHTLFTKLRFGFIINTLFTPLRCCLLCTTLLKLQSSSHMLCFSFLSYAKWRPLSASFRGPRRWKLEGEKSGL
jgi:hypothetical protein